MPRMIKTVSRNRRVGLGESRPDWNAGKALGYLLGGCQGPRIANRVNGLGTTRGGGVSESARASRTTT